MAVRSSAPLVFQAGTTCTVELDVCDALGFAQSVRTLIRTQRTPMGTAEIYERVAAQILAAARVAIAQSKAGGR